MIGNREVFAAHSQNGVMEYGSVGVMEKRRLWMRPINCPLVTSGFRTVGWLSLLEFGGVW